MSERGKMVTKQKILYYYYIMKKKKNKKGNGINCGQKKDEKIKS